MATPDMTDIVFRALCFATKAHEGQTRRYSGEPYIAHPIAVAEIVRSVPHTSDMIAAALLHDTIEDCVGVTFERIRHEFGDAVCEIVIWLTSISDIIDGNRAARKAADRDYLAGAPRIAKTIKLADIIDNTRTIRERDPEFWRVYRLEKIALLDVLRDGDRTLWARAAAQCGMEMA